MAVPPCLVHFPARSLWNTQEVRLPCSLGLPKSETAGEAQQGSLRAKPGLPVKLLPRILSPGQAWPGLWEEQGCPQHSCLELGAGGWSPTTREAPGGWRPPPCSHSLPLRSDPGLPSCQRAGATHSRNLSRQLLRGFVHFSLQSTLNQVWCHRDSETPSLSMGRMAT